MRRSPGPALWVESGGTGQPLLVMLHGLGANAAAWQRLRPIVEAGWRGRWLAPELRAHGRSGHATPYGMAMHAADVAGLLDPADDIVILGHSKGGGVADGAGLRLVRHHCKAGRRLRREARLEQ